MNCEYFEVMIPVLVNSTIVSGFEAEADMVDVNYRRKNHLDLYSLPSLTNLKVITHVYTLKEYKEVRGWVDTLTDELNGDSKLRVVLFHLRVKMEYGYLGLGPHATLIRSAESHTTIKDKEMTANTLATPYKFPINPEDDPVRLTNRCGITVIENFPMSKLGIHPRPFLLPCDYKYVTAVRLLSSPNPNYIDSIIEVAAYVKTVIVHSGSKKLIDSIVDKLGTNPFPLLEEVTALDQDTTLYFFDCINRNHIKRLNIYSSIVAPSLHVEELVVEQIASEFDFASIGSSTVKAYCNNNIEISNNDTIITGLSTFLSRCELVKGFVYRYNTIDLRYMKERSHTTLVLDFCIWNLPVGCSMTSEIRLRLNTIFATGD